MTTSREYIDRQLDCKLTSTATPWREVLDTDGLISVQVRSADGSALSTVEFLFEVSNDGGPDGYAVNAAYSTNSTITGAGMLQAVTAGSFRYARLRVNVAEAGKFADAFWWFKPTAGAVAAKL